ncbi:MAG: DUF5615 family PIN-like protein [Chloroflexota bacterium]
MVDEVKLFIALYADEDVHKAFAKEIRRHGFDAISADEEKRREESDEKQLEYAVSQGRALLSHNQKHFEPLHEKWLHEGREHAGIILSHRIEIGELLRRTLRLLDQVTADEMHNSLRYLSDFAERKK